MNAWDFFGGLVWPALLLFFYLDQRHQLPRIGEWLKDRSFKAGGMGVTVEVQAKQRSDDKNPVASEKAGDASSPAGGGVRPRFPVAVNIAANALRETKDLSAEDRAEALASAFANARVLEAFEFVLNRIYGSQLEALKLLRDVPQASMSEAVEFYQRVVAAYPDFYRAYGFNRWTGWMEGQSLVERRPDGFAISEFGRDFLAYLAEAGLDVRRPY